MEPILEAALKMNQMMKEIQMKETTGTGIMVMETMMTVLMYPILVKEMADQMAKKMKVVM